MDQNSKPAKKPGFLIKSVALLAIVYIVCICVMTIKSDKHCLEGVEASGSSKQGSAAFCFIFGTMAAQEKK